MAGWNDLPTELKALVVAMVDDEGLVRNGLADASTEELRAMLALGAIDRQLHALVSPLLWQTINISDGSISRHVSFAEIAPFKGGFVHQLMLYHPSLTANQLARISETYGALLASLTNLKTLALHGRSKVVTGIVPLLPPKFSVNLQRLLMEEPDGSYLEPVDVAAILHALPQLVEVELRGVNSKDGAALAIRALRHLPKLQKLKMADGDALVHRSLGQPWSSSLTSLNLDRSELIHLPVLQALLEQHSSTLHLLSLPLLPHYPDFPHFSLPHLEELRLWTTETSAPLLRSFSDSPLRRLRVKMYVEGDPIKMEVEAVLKTVQHHGGTLKRVRVTARAFNAAEQDEQEVLDRLEALCLKQGIKYQYELESP